VYEMLNTEANNWRALHRRPTERAEWNERRRQHEVLALRHEAFQARRARKVLPIKTITCSSVSHETALRAELAVAQAKVRDLQQRLFGRKSERRSASQAPATRAGRGQQRGAQGHGRTMQPYLVGSKCPSARFPRGKWSRTWPRWRFRTRPTTQHLCAQGTHWPHQDKPRQRQHPATPRRKTQAALR